MVDETPDETGELSCVAKQQRRLRTTVGFVESPKSKIDLTHALVVGKPLEHYMNSAFALDKKMTRLNFEMKAAGSGAMPQSLVDLVADVRKHVHKFITGRAGHTVVLEYTELLQAPLQSERWTVLGPDCTSTDYLEAYVTNVALLGDSWRRLEFKFLCSPWDVFDLATFLGHTSAETRRRINTLREKVRKCSGCAELSLTVPLLFMLIHPARYQDAIDMIDDILVTAKPSSISCERNHLVAHYAPYRGLARSGTSHQIESYLSNARADHKAVRKAVQVRWSHNSRTDIEKTRIFTRSV